MIIESIIKILTEALLLFIQGITSLNIRRVLNSSEFDSALTKHYMGSTSRAMIWLSEAPCFGVHCEEVTNFTFT